MILTASYNYRNTIGTYIYIICILKIGFIKFMMLTDLIGEVHKPTNVTGGVLL